MEVPQEAIEEINRSLERALVLQVEASNLLSIALKKMRGKEWDS